MEEFVLVMHEDTWEAVKDEAFESASKQPDPIKYLKKLGEVDIVIDNALKYGITEMWEKDKYYEFKKYWDELK